MRAASITMIAIERVRWKDTQFRTRLSKLRTFKQGMKLLLVCGQREPAKRSGFVHVARVKRRGCAPDHTERAVGIALHEGVGFKSAVRQARTFCSSDSRKF